MTAGILDVPVRVPISLSTPVKRNPYEAAVLRLAFMYDILFDGCALFLRLRAIALALRAGLALITAAAFRPCASRRATHVYFASLHVGECNIVREIRTALLASRLNPIAFVYIQTRGVGG